MQPSSASLVSGSALLVAALPLCWQHIVQLSHASLTVVLSLQLSALSSVLLGTCMAEVGVSIQHDGNHGASGGNTSLEYILGATLDIVGASSFMWKQQHVVGHHTYTNVDGLDPDFRVKDPDVRRVSQHQPWQSYQVPHLDIATHLFRGHIMMCIPEIVLIVRIPPYVATQTTINHSINC